MKVSAPNCSVTGSQASVQMKERPKCWIDGQARSRILYAIQPSRNTLPADAARASPRNSVSPSRSLRRSRPVAAGPAAGAAVSSSVDMLELGVSLPSDSLDLLDLPVREGLDRHGERLEEERRA